MTFKSCSTLLLLAGGASLCLCALALAVLFLDPMLRAFWLTLTWPR